MAQDRTSPAYQYGQRVKAAAPVTLLYTCNGTRHVATFTDHDTARALFDRLTYCDPSLWQGSTQLA